MIKRGILFDKIHSFYDLNLILSKVEIPPAKPKTSYIDIAGGDGSLDLTEAHGDIKFSDRECKFTFTMNPEFDLSDTAFEEKKTEISNLLNGRTFRITLEKDDDYYYEGRCTVNDYLSNKRIRQFVISAKVKPYKYKQNKTVLKYTLSAEEKSLNVINGRKPVVPEITVTDNNTRVVFGQIEKMFNAGTYKILDFQLKQGNNVFVASGSGIITFTYQEAEL